MMKFHVRAVEVLRRRHKWNRPCNENWANQDIDIKKKHTKYLGCRPPYLQDLEGIPICTTENQMKERFYFRKDGYDVDPPCREMKRILGSYLENTNPKNHSWATDGSFLIGIVYSDEYFKEISQTR